MLDYIIVGAGLAGGTLAYRLKKAGKSIAIIDDADPNAAYHTAGGVWNAISFKRIIKGWQADNLTDEADVFYNDLQKEFELDFYKPKEIIRTFSDVTFQNNWMAKSNEPEFSSYLEDKCSSDLNKIPIKAPYGCGTVKKAGFVKLKIFIPTIQKFLKETCPYLSEPFEYDKLKIDDERVSYKNLEAKSIIFCEGYKVVDNPYFNWVPMKATKGEVLKLKNPGWDFDYIFNNGKHLIDNKDGTMGVGATFDWANLDNKPSEKGKKELLKHLEKNIDFKNWEVLGQKAAIRPTVSDRRPLTGVHPKYKNLYIFNGLGTKGVLIAPWLSKMMCSFLTKNSPLHNESDLSRFIKKHFNK